MHKEWSQHEMGIAISLAGEKEVYDAELADFLISLTPASLTSCLEKHVSVCFFFSDEEGSLYYFTFPGEITTGRVSVNSILQQCIKQENVLMSEDFWMKRGGLFFFFFFPKRVRKFFLSENALEMQ